MSAKRVAQRHSATGVVRDQILRPEFQQAMRTTSAAKVDKRLPKQFADLLDRLDAAEARKNKRT